MAIKNRFLSGLPSHIWEVYINGSLADRQELAFNNATKAAGQSETYEYTPFDNEFDGHFWNLKYGSAYLSYFIWVNWSGTKTVVDPPDAPYEVILVSDTEFYIRGPS